MTISSSTTTNHSASKSIVIQSYLNGKSRDQISKETRISTGKISNIISDWKTVIKMPYVEELRGFAVTVRKSGMSIAQCVRGYRIAQLMDNLGISDDGDYYNDEDEYKSIEKNYSSNSSSIINYSNKKAIDFLIFVQDIYINCIQLKIHLPIYFHGLKIYLIIILVNAYCFQMTMIMMMIPIHLLW